MSETGIVVYKDESELSPVEAMVQRISIVNHVYKEVMKRDLHFGKIPNTDKDTLLLPGAQKICTLFKIVPKIESETISDLGNGHREIVMVIGLYHRESEQFWGQGTGSCSTMESKFKYRNESLGAVPSDYWENKEKYPGVKTKKGADGSWFMYRRVENPDIADVWNTVRKMCFKRALVSATITAAGIADIFNQDLEEMDPDQISGGVGNTSGGASTGAAAGTSPSGAPGKAQKMDFVTIQQRIASIGNLADLDSYCVELHNSFPNMTEKQKPVIDKMFNKRISELNGDGSVPASEMFGPEA